MKTLRRAAGILSLLTALATAGLAQITFKPPEVTSVTDAYRIDARVVDGFVVLDVSIDATGAVSGTAALRDPGAMAHEAEASIRKWGFRPASGSSGPIPSEMTAVFVYRPRSYAQPPRDFKPVLPESPADSADPDYIPPGIISVGYPKYPENSVAAGSVIVQVTVDRAGSAESTKVLRMMGGPFTALATDALGKWRFQAATLRGKPVASKIAVAFIFQAPLAPSE
ncbi:MAG: energy transducer TonB [Candidatus Acidiferrales bacterium]